MIITIDGFGEDQMSREILRVSERAEDPRPVLTDIRADFYRYEDILFNTQGASGGAAWKPISPNTVASKRKRGMDTRILHETLTLRRSLTSEVPVDAVSRIDRQGLFVGSNVPYGVYHQSTKPRTVLPRRPPVMLTEDVKRNWIKKLQRWLITGEMA